MANEVNMQAELRIGTDPEGTIEIAENGEYSVKDYSTAEVNVPGPEMEELNITPTKSEQNFEAEEGHAFDAVNVDPIPEQYIVPEGVQDITENGTYDVTLKSGVQVAVPTGSEIVVDPTLTISGAAADAKVTGDAIAELKQVETLNFAWKKFEKPAAFPFSLPFNIFSDGHNFKTEFNFDDYKNTGGTTYYVTARGKSAMDGLTPETATGFASAIQRVTDGGTIVILPGDYDRDSLGWGSTVINSNINIIGLDKVRIFAGQLNMAFTKTAGYTNVYQTTRSVARQVINYKAIEGQYILYDKKSSIADVDANAGSFYISGSTVYVHDLGGGNPGANVCVTVQSEKWLNVSNNSDKDLKVCYQNIELIGKAEGVTFNRSDTEHDLTVVCDNVRVMYCGDSQNDGFDVYGGTAIFNQCKAMNGFKDGFNYNGVNKSGTATDCYCIENDCIAGGNGIGQTSETQNGSTGHAGVKILRINGRYYDNFGANIADVQAETMSLNLGCMAFYSAGTAGGANENFAAQQAGATMWLYGCVAVGAVKDLSCVSGSSMYLDKCTYKNKAGSGTYTEDDTLGFDIWTLYRLAERIKR